MQEVMRETARRKREVGLGWTGFGWAWLGLAGLEWVRMSFDWV